MKEETSEAKAEKWILMKKDRKSRAGRGISLFQARVHSQN